MKPTLVTATAVASPAGQKLAAKHYSRLRKPELANTADIVGCAKLPLFTLASVFGNWAQAQAKHFADGGVFDQITGAGK